MIAMPDNNSRHHERVQLRDFSKVHVANSASEATPIDVSLQGLRIRTQIPVRSDMRIDVFLFDKTIQSKARVCWVEEGKTSEEGNEVGLELEYPDLSIYKVPGSYLFDNQEKLHFLALTPIELSPESLAPYLKITNINAVAELSVDKILKQLSLQKWDLLILDTEADDTTGLLEHIASNEEFSFLPIIIVSERITTEVIKLRSIHHFLEIFPKPANIDELLQRVIILMEQTGRFAESEANRKRAEQELAEIQQSMANQNNEMMGMLSQVMQQSEAMGQLIQLQEALLGLKTGDDVIHFAQEWTIQNFNAGINLWYCEHEPYVLMGRQPLEHPHFSIKHRISEIRKLMRQRTKILQDEFLAMRKNNFVLEVVSHEVKGDVVDRLTFFMKVLAPVMQSKQQEVELKRAYDKVEHSLTMEEKSRQMLNKELRAAAEVQDLLIPRDVPDLEALEVACYYQSAVDMGGDWFYVSEFPQSQQILLGIGDVTGHGPQAALVTSIISGFFADLKLRFDSNSHNSAEGVLENLPSPGHILEELNEILCDVTQGKGLMTFHLSQYNPETRKLVYASASHTSPLLFRPSGIKDDPHNIKYTQPLLQHGYQLGNRGHSKYTESLVTLEEGDYVVWYTDGLNECLGEDGEPYSIHRLKQLLISCSGAKAQEIMDIIVEDLNDFRGSVPLEDDLACLLIRVR